MNMLATMIVILSLLGCAAHKIESSSCGRPAGTYRIPDGWVATKVEGPSRVRNVIQQIGHTAREDPSITIDAFCQFDRRFPRTQQGCADSYLDGIHDVDDDSVKLEVFGTVQNQNHGEITLYRYYSDWLGDHLVAMIVTTYGYGTAELWADTATGRKTHTAAFKVFVQGIKLQLPSKS